MTPSGRSARRPDRSVKDLFEISDGELAALRDDIVLCRRRRAATWMKEQRGLLLSANPGHPNTAAMIGYLAQWADGPGSLAKELSELLLRFPQADRGRLPIGSYLFLRFAEGVLNFTAGKPDTGDFDFVITVGSSGCADEEVLLLAHLWKADVERKSGALDRGMWHAKRSGELALHSGYPRLAAKAQALEGLLMLDGGLPHAGELLQQAESVLLETEDWLWQGRIQDGFGRAALNEGRYQSAFEHFTSAKDFFDHGREPHAELGWAYFSMARAQRLIASRLANNIDASAELRRHSLRAEATEISPSSSVSRQRLDQLRNDTFTALAHSAAIFRSLNSTRALDSVRLERGALWADSGDLQRATRHAHESFLGGMRHKDVLLMAQARLLQSHIERTHCEEGVGLDLALHAQRAHEYAKEALALGLQCDAMPSVKRRLLAAIYVCQGLLLLNEFFNNSEAARECCHSASEYVNPSERNELWDEYQALVLKALHSGSIDAKLRKWCEGLPEGKTFQQIIEEFADLVIPAVWAREGKNISRVVTKLSISPKKVRRILTRVGLKH